MAAGTLRTAPAGTRAGRREWLALSVLMLPVLLVAVDNTVLSFAVPAISLALNPTATGLLWIIDIYPLILAGLLVPMGSMADRFGRRRMLMVGSLGFTAVSVVAAFAPSANALIGCRAMLGLFGAMLMPSTLSLIRNIFTDAGQRRTAIAIWAAAFSGGAALGPLLGGLLLENFWWGGVVLLAVPMLIPLAILAPLCVPESKDPAPGRIDTASIALSFGTMVPLIYGIKALATEAPGPGSLLPLLVGLVGVVLGVVFVHRQLRQRTPMLDVRLFTNPVFSGAVAANLLSIFSLVGFLYFVSQHLQLVAGQSPTRAGLTLLPGLVMSIVTGLLVVRLARRIRPAFLVATGLLLNAAGYLTVLLNGSGSESGLLLAFVLLGSGVGMAETISNDLILATAPAAKAGAASAISETAYEVGSVLGTAVLGSILAAAYRFHVSVPDSLSAQAHEGARQTLGGAINAAASLPPGQAAELIGSAQRAFDSGAGVVAAVGLAMMLAAAAMSLLTLRRVARG
ncbi:MFS transporter [Arthrobacter sp. A5]|uniref:MFS transporter n=1 Tax=Arthrobacter sp. A5 TaxID=576926 RepID=UPI003DA7DF58